ncbi:MAG: zinc-ribbon domain-containing protein, partial [Thermodesulfobacteriota bacterium]
AYGEVLEEQEPVKVEAEAVVEEEPETETTIEVGVAEEEPLVTVEEEPVTEEIETGPAVTQAERARPSIADYGIIVAPEAEAAEEPALAGEVEEEVTLVDLRKEEVRVEPEVTVEIPSAAREEISLDDYGRDLRAEAPTVEISSVDEEEAVALDSFGGETAGMEATLEIPSGEEEEAVSLGAFEHEAPAPARRPEPPKKKPPAPKPPEPKPEPPKRRPLVATVHCPNCQAASTVEPASIPDKGTTVKCPSCKQRYFVEKDPTSGVVTAGAPPAEPEVKVPEKVSVPLELRLEQAKQTGRRVIVAVVVLVVLAGLGLGGKFGWDYYNSSIKGQEQLKAAETYHLIKNIETAALGGQGWEAYADTVTKADQKLTELSESSEYRRELEQVMVNYRLAKEIWDEESFWEFNRQFQDTGPVADKYRKACPEVAEAEKGGLPQELEVLLPELKAACQPDYFAGLEPSDTARIDQIKQTLDKARRVLWARASKMLEQYWAKNKP